MRNPLILADVIAALVGCLEPGETAQQQAWDLAEDCDRHPETDHEQARYKDEDGETLCWTASDVIEAFPTAWAIARKRLPPEVDWADNGARTGDEFTYLLGYLT